MLNLIKRYTIVKNKINLKNSIDFINLTNGEKQFVSKQDATTLMLSYPSKYRVFKKLKLVEKKIIKKNKKIIFIEKSNLVVRIFDFK